MERPPRAWVERRRWRALNALPLLAPLRQLRIACEGLVDTVGRVTLGGKAHDAPQAFTAHPKRDLATGDLFFFR